MRIILTLCFCLILLYPAKSMAQGIGQVRVQYANPGISNDLELIAEVLIPSQPAYRLNYTARVSRDTLYLVACYYSGIQGSPQQLTDIIHFTTFRHLEFRFTLLFLCCN